MRIAIIPARGGSKRIPRKNIRDFCGAPMISRTIDTAKQSKLFDKVMVSTDDEEIALIARSCGVDVPYLRPKFLSGDAVTTAPVIKHTLLELNMHQEVLESDLVCCIYPCTPFVRPEHLSASMNLLIKSGRDFVYPVVEYSHPAYRAMTMDVDGSMHFLFPRFELTRTQDLRRSFHDPGQFYWGLASAWLDEKKMHTDGIGMEFPKYCFVDVDTEEDWCWAEQIFQSYTRI